MSNCTIHCVAVPHFYHGCSRLTFHEFDLWKEKSFYLSKENHIKSSTHRWNIPIRFHYQQKKISAVHHSPSPRCHRDRRYWRCGLRSSSGGPGRTTWQRETRRGCRTLREEGAGAHNQVHSFFHHVLSLVDPCGDLHIHSSHRIHGNRLLNDTRGEREQIISQAAPHPRVKILTSNLASARPLTYKSKLQNSNYDTAPLNCHCVEHLLTKLYIIWTVFTCIKVLCTLLILRGR